MSYVMIPRAVFKEWWSKPWVEVLAAAEEKTDGLCVVDGPSAKVCAGNAVVHEGDDKWGKGKTLLLNQNW